MQIVPKQKPLKKRAQYRKIALEIRGSNNAAFFDSKSDMRDFCRTVKRMGLKYQSRKENGWQVWVL